MSVLKTYDPAPNSFPPSKTYQLDLQNKRLGRQTCDTVEAMNQAIWLALATERFDYLIYSTDYGVELNDLIGMPRSYVEADISRRLTEALKQDDRVKNTKDFTYDFLQGQIDVGFTVLTAFGEIRLERRFSIGGNR